MNFVTVLFAVFFVITRNLMIFPFWLITREAMHTEAYRSCKLELPLINWAFMPPCLILDMLNVYWAGKTFRIGWRSLKSLWQADWRSDIHRAHSRLRRRLKRFSRTSTVDEEDDSVANRTGVRVRKMAGMVAKHLPAIDSFIYESSSSSGDEYDDSQDEGEDSTMLTAPPPPPPIPSSPRRTSRGRKQL